MGAPAPARSRPKKRQKCAHHFETRSREKSTKQTAIVAHTAPEEVASSLARVCAYTPLLRADKISPQLTDDFEHLRNQERETRRHTATPNCTAHCLQASRADGRPRGAIRYSLWDRDADLDCDEDPGSPGVPPTVQPGTPPCTPCPPSQHPGGHWRPSSRKRGPYARCSRSPPMTAWPCWWQRLRRGGGGGAPAADPGGPGAVRGVPPRPGGGVGAGVLPPRPPQRRAVRGRQCELRVPPQF